MRCRERMRSTGTARAVRPRLWQSPSKLMPPAVRGSDRGNSDIPKHSGLIWQMVYMILHAHPAGHRKESVDQTTAPSPIDVANLGNKVTIITGTSSGISYETVKLFVEVRPNWCL